MYSPKNSEEDVLSVAADEPKVVRTAANDAAPIRIIKKNPRTNVMSSTENDLNGSVFSNVTSVHTPQVTSMPLTARNVVSPRIEVRLPPQGEPVVTSAPPTSRPVSTTPVVKTNQKKSGKPTKEESNTDEEDFLSKTTGWIKSFLSSSPIFSPRKETDPPAVQPTKPSQKTTTTKKETKRTTPDKNKGTVGKGKSRTSSHPVKETGSTYKKGASPPMRQRGSTMYTTERSPSKKTVTSSTSKEKRKTSSTHSSHTTPHSASRKKANSPTAKNSEKNPSTAARKRSPEAQEKAKPRKTETHHTLPVTKSPSPTPVKPASVTPKKEKAKSPAVTATKGTETPQKTAPTPTVETSPIGTKQVYVAPPSAPEDEPTVLCVATKYTFQYATSTWMGAPTMIRIPHPNRGLAQGGMRACFEVFEVSDDGLSTAMVAKLFRRTILEVSERDYFNEGEIQKTCQVFLKEFSNALKKTGTTGVTPLSYIDSVVVYIPLKQIPEPMRNVRKGFFSYKTENTREFLFTMEPKLEGHFTKYTSNDGAVFYSNEVRQAIADHNARLEVLKTCEAFSHFTLEESGGSMLVCDLQGVQSFLTDPQIHTIDGECFGMGNMGAIGMQRWLARHKCNDICKKMGLKSCEKTTLKRFDNVEKREKYFKKAQANYKKSAPPLA